MISAIRAGVLTSSGGVRNELSWRILGNGATYNSAVGTYGQAIYEIEFYEDASASGTNVNIGATVSASGYEGAPYLPTYANDNNAGTYWQYNNSNAATDTWWQVTFGEVKTIRAVRFKLFTAGYHQASYKLQVWRPALSNWVTVATLNLTQSDATQTFTNLQ